MQSKNARAFLSDAAIVLLMCVSSVAASKPKLPPQGVVPDEQTAVKIAEVVFQRIFGAEEVSKWQPYRAQLDKNGAWTVSGTLPSGSRGGTPMLKIKKQDGRIVEVWHSM